MTGLQYTSTLSLCININTSVMNVISNSYGILRPKNGWIVQIILQANNFAWCWIDIFLSGPQPENQYGHQNSRWPPHGFKIYSLVRLTWGYTVFRTVSVSCPMISAWTNKNIEHLQEEFMRKRPFLIGHDWYNNESVK